MRLAAGDHDDRLLLDLALQRVDRLVLLMVGGGELRIAALRAPSMDWPSTCSARPPILAILLLRADSSSS